MNLDSIRKDYRFASLQKKDVDGQPIKQFEKWMNSTLRAGVNEATAMALATVGEDGFPQSRIVLLKDFNELGFTFFTNYESEKGLAIAHNPVVSLHFFWPQMERQIRILGKAEKTGGAVSDQYFLSRPVMSQIAAIASGQSREIPSRQYLEDRFEQIKKDAEDQPLERPKNWGGYLVRPVKMEFWQGRKSRLHDRILYKMVQGNWVIKRLSP